MEILAVDSRRINTMLRSPPISISKLNIFLSNFVLIFSFLVLVPNFVDSGFVSKTSHFPERTSPSDSDPASSSIEINSQKVKRSGFEVFQASKRNKRSADAHNGNADPKNLVSMVTFYFTFV